MSVAWSFSALDSFETCPYRHYLTRVTRAVSEPETDAILWGNRVHKALEMRVKDGTPLPKELNRYESMIKKFESTGAVLQPERKYCLDINKKLVEWFSKKAWCRVVVDLGIFNGRKAAALDYKTGKRKPNSTQLMLTAATILEVHEEVSEVSTGFLWLKDRKMDSDIYTRADLPSIWAIFQSKVDRLNAAYQSDTWNPKPSGLCRSWCPCKQCKHNGR